MIRDFTMADFSPALDESFELDLDGTRIALKLEQVQELPKTLRETGSFRLQFRGPREPLLPQATYSLERGGEPHVIFIVPIRQDEGSTTYEAIFN